jgi:hypothetical protein
MYEYIINELVIISCFFFSFLFASVSIAGIIILMYESIEEKYRKWYFDEMLHHDFGGAGFSRPLINKDYHQESNGLDKHENGYDH